jgi:hypothetical protein
VSSRIDGKEVSKSMVPPEIAQALIDSKLSALAVYGRLAMLDQ